MKTKVFCAGLAIAALVGGLLLMHGRVKAQSTGTSALLFNFVTNQVGYDTIIAINNASLTPFNNAGTPGSCTIYYYGSTLGGGAGPPSQTTQPIPPGGQLTLTLATGGTYGVTATPGFQGYMIAVCNFPFAQGVEAIGPLGGQNFSFLPAQSIPSF